MLASVKELPHKEIELSQDCFAVGKLGHLPPDLSFRFLWNLSPCSTLWGPTSLEGGPQDTTSWRQPRRSRPDGR